jgi:nucleotide-binding universal stress UspA family protein
MFDTATLTREAVSPRPARRARRGRGPVIVAVGREDIHHLLEAAKQAASRLGANVRVVSVLPPIFVSEIAGAPVYVPAAEAELDLRESISRMVEREVHDVADESADMTWEVVLGDVASVLTSRATHLGASLLVLGLGRHRAVERLLAAETTLRVMRHSSAPVLAINATFDGDPKRVVVATDFSARSALAAQAVIPLLAEGATLHLVHVWQPSGSRVASIVAMEKRYADSLADRFARLRSVLAVPPGVSVTTSAIEGNVVERVLEFADSSNADLIVAGRQGLSFLTRLMVGSVTTALVRGAACSVLVVPEPSYPALDRMQRQLTGMTSTKDPAQWQQALADFTHRNAGRRCELEVDDPDIGAQRQETGYAFLGASYDPHDCRVELMIGGSHAGASHLSRGVSEVQSVAILCDRDDHDLGLCLKHGNGQTLLRFVPEP